MTDLVLIDEELTGAIRGSFYDVQNQVGLKFLTSPAETKTNALSRWRQYAQVLLSSNESMQVR